MVPSAADCLKLAEEAEGAAALTKLPNERSRFLASAERWRALAGRFSGSP
jgi:hypothetical protein